jgi:hypothetical protein
MSIVIQKVLRICNVSQNLAFPLAVLVLRVPHGYARLDPDRCARARRQPAGWRRAAVSSFVLPACDRGLLS